MKSSVVETQKAILPKKNSLWKTIYRYRVLYIFLLPAIVWFAVFGYIPMYALTIAFKDYSFKLGFLHSPWAGLKYVKDFFGYYDFWNLIRNSFFISIIKIIFSFPAPIILALMLNEVKTKKFKSIVQTVSYLPYFVSWAVVGTMFIKMLSPSGGIINEVLINLGIYKESYYFLAEPKFFYITVVFTEIWKNVGYGSIIYLAALSGIDPSLYEAAAIDGAGKWKQLKYITLPGIKFVIGLSLILSMGGLLKAGFEQVLIFQTPPTIPYSEVLETYSVRKAFLEGNFSYATLVTLFQNTVCLVFIVITNYTVKKISDVSVW